MPVIITKKTSRKKDKTWYYFEWGKDIGQRMASGIFTYTRPLDQIQKNHNKEALNILASKKSQMILDAQAAGGSYIPLHRLKNNFLDFYAEFVKKNSRSGNRSIAASHAAFKDFLGTNFISALDIDENLCERFRNYLLDKFNGETPADYFMRFRRMLKAAKKQGYFKENPAEDVKAKSKPSAKKEILEADEYRQLMGTFCSNYEVKKAAIFSLYTGFRWCDIISLDWNSIKESSVCIIQQKTKVQLEVPLHKLALEIIGERKKGMVFHLPTHTGTQKVLDKWVEDAKINKRITWHCFRHSISVLLQDEGTDAATVAGMLGHTTTKYVHKTYQRYKLKSAAKAIEKLPH
ncbi:MAG: site-specific integrase [Bacteroidetes bacterium]|nr:site-specific integrase [Bacteroidota bacterium]